MIIGIIALFLVLIYSLFFFHEKVKHGQFTGKEDEEK